MATTAIWNVKGWLGHALIYIENPEKTENPKFYQPELSTSENCPLSTVHCQLGDVLDYAMQDKKTLKKWKIEHNHETLQQFVSGVNCFPDTARAEMLSVKKRFGKEDGNVAFHGYQSFSPEDNITPELAHEIGQKLAQELWGERFQVVVATHLDKAHHIHNHFVLNSVSFLDGKKYNDCKETYRQMRQASDRLCKQYNLSVIKNPAGRKKHYAEWQAEQQGKPTYRSIMKADIDRAISMSFTDTQFFDNLKKMGYEVKMGKDLTLKLKGRRNGLKLERNFGRQYSLDAIRQRILGQMPTKKKIAPQNQKQRYRMKGLLFLRKPARRKGSLRGLYLYYCYLLGIRPKGKQNPRQYLPYSIRSDVIKLDKMMSEFRFLSDQHIDTLPELTEKHSSITKEITFLTEKRQGLRNEMRHKTLPQTQDNLKKQISGISSQLAVLRKQRKYCENIAERSGMMKEKLKSNIKGKEAEQNVQRRRCGRADISGEPERY